MSHYSKLLIAYIFSAILSLSIVLTQFPVVSLAADDSRIAIKHTSTWGDYVFNYGWHRCYWTIEDTTGIPLSTLTDPNYFATLDGSTFLVLKGSEVLTTCLNNVLGVIMDSDKLADFKSQLWNAIKKPDLSNLLFAQGGVYNGSGQFLGYALNDISGCALATETVPDSTSINVPGQFSNNVYNFYNYYMGSNASTLPFFTFYPPSNSFINSHALNLYDRPDFENFSSNLSSLTTNYGLCGPIMLLYDSDMSGFDGIYGSSGFDFNVYGVDVTDMHFLATNTSEVDWNYILNYYGVTSDHPELLFSELWSKPMPYTDSNSGHYISFYRYDSSGTLVTNGINCDLIDDTYKTYSSSSTSFSISNTASISSNGTRRGMRIPFGDVVTVYRDANAYNSVQNHTYYPDSYVSNRYYNYNPSNDNSFNTTITVLNDSHDTNTTIYEDCNNDYYEYVDNDTVDTTEIINNNTTIINNYYPIVDDDPVGPDDPDDPSGGGGGSDDPDIDNSTVLDAILDALGRFFKAIGKILATILAGLLEVVDSVLEAIAGIMENFTGITEFLQALFSWLPSPIPEVIAAGVSICILFAVFRFIRG